MVSNQPKLLDSACAELESITGQKAVKTKARKSVSNFKIREGMEIGARVTLRDRRMWEFLDRFINVALPRIRDFRGVPVRLSGSGDYTLGLKDQLIFPEIDYDKVDEPRGMNVTIVTTANTDEEGRELLSLLGMLVYIWFRFEWQFGVGAVVALLHDVALTIGVFALLGLEFNLSTVAAILTIAGYSINDTVVVYDRVRENLRKFKQMSLYELLNLSVNGTLSRTLLTSVTTLIALGALYFFGGEVIKGFSFAMIWGVIVGTYSSIFIAVPLLVYMNLRRSGLIVGEEMDDAPTGKPADQG